MNETLKLGIALMVVGLIASLALALTNQFTVSKIAEQQELAFKESLTNVLKEADDFKLKLGRILFMMHTRMEKSLVVLLKPHLLVIHQMFSY